MARPSGPIEVEGLKELQRAVRRSTDSDMPKRMGMANKQVGAKFIADWLHPRPQAAAVGQGAGATVRPSASKREVLLRVGGAHRRGRSPQMQWGKRPARIPGQRAPERPYIRESADRHADDIGDAYLKAVSAAMRPAFHKTEP